MKVIIDLLGIADDDTTEEVFFKALEHASFWNEIFNAKGYGDYMKTLQNCKPCLKVASSIANMQNILDRKKLGHSLIQKLKLKENDMLQLLACNSKQKIQSDWMSCCTALNACLENINVIREIFQTLKVRVSLANVPSIVGNTLEYLAQLENKILKDEILVSDIFQDVSLGTYMTETAGYCQRLIKPIKSQVFWNILHEEFKQMKMEETEQGVDDGGDPLNGMSLPYLFGEEFEDDIVSSFRISYTMKFICSVSSTCFDKYKQVWTPYFKQENRPLEEFKRTFAKIKTPYDMEQEIKMAEEFCYIKSPFKLKNTLLKFADLMVYIQTVDAVTNSIKIFKFHENVEIYTDIVKSFHKLLKVKKGKDGDLSNMFMNDLETVLERVEGIRKFVSSEVIEILAVLKSATSLLSFLEEVIDEDIRNLIDAVEEHSEQYVRESTVSDLIEVKRFFYPILKKTYGNGFTDFFALLRNQLTSGFSNIPAKIEDCMENLHTLRALYKNVANRGERTKEIIDSIIVRGRFCFRMETQVCDIIVRYKQDKKTVSHNSADLSDLRSRALLLINAEDREKTRQKTVKKREDLEKFLQLVDTAFNISGMCLKLRQSGHFDYSRFETTCDHKDLADRSAQLVTEYEEWTHNIASCRDTYYYMNFIYPAQLQQLFEYLYKDGGNEKTILTCLQFINRSFENTQILKEKIKALPPMSDHNGILQNIAQALQGVFEDYCPVKTPFTDSKKKAKITDIVQEGIPYIAALEEGSPLVIRTMFALYINTTNRLPDASQILLCREETTLDDIDLILRRCTGDMQKGRLYCIANIEMLSNYVQNRFVEILHRLPSGNYLLSIICCGHTHHPFLDQFSDCLGHPTPMTETSLKTCLRNQWPDVLVVSSDIPGLGKTEMVHRRAREKGMCVATLHISGQIDIQSIIQNLTYLKLRKYHVLHIDIGITSSPSELDSVLFQLIILGHVSTGSTSYTLVTNHVVIEISNTVGQTLCNSLPTTTCFSRVNIDWNNYADMKVSTELNSPVQVVCQYLKVLSTGTLDRSDIYLTGANAITPLKSKECVSLLGQCFSSAGDMSYTLLQTFVNVLSDQLKKLSASVFFRTANISAMVGDKNVPTVKSNLVKALVNASQEFACRSVQSCRSLQAASLVSTSDEPIKDLNSAEELARRVAGMIRWEDSNHLMILFHQNVQTVSALYRDKTKIPQSIQTLFESQMKKGLDNFNLKTRRELQDILQMLTRSKATKLSDTVLEEMAASYALTPDNLLKMVLISLRINSHIPVVIMGETGCGKTSLVRYLADISEVQFEVLSIHAGIDETTIVHKVREVNQNAKLHLDNNYWIFLDEINTCDHLGVINSIICHRYFQGDTLAPNVTVLAACNPYRLRTQSTILTAGLQGKVKTDELSRLVYRVHPLPEALIDFVWDYGSLNEKDEKFYISKMVTSVFEGHCNSSMYVTLLTDLLAMSQNVVRKTEDTDSCVSLRDVDRCKKLIIWFLQFLREKKTKILFEYGIEIKAIVLGLAVSYHSRFADVKTRAKYRENISHLVSKSFRTMNSKTVLEIIRDEQNDILNRMVLPSGIAKNTALQENVFVVLVCILNKIPIFLVGKPGCSKSLSMQLIRSNLRGKDSKDVLFQTMPQLFCVSFQGSESSTSDGIMKVFEKAKNYQKHNEKDVLSVVILDEIGLAEVSRFNPLKVLHGLLEPGNGQNLNIAVVGISNWALDAAKMNRAVHLSRPDMDLDELKYTGYSISSAIVDEMRNDQDMDTSDYDDYGYFAKKLKDLFNEIAIAYFKYVSSRQKFANFHGLRDYYSLIKYIGRCSEVFKNGDDNLESDIILKGIARNFGGLPTEMVGIVEIFQESFPSLRNKMMFVTELIKDNLNDDSCRHLMLITNGDSVISVLESHLNETNRPFEIIFGSHFDDDLSDDYNYRILSRIILCMEQGLVLILKGLESIYGSLYDMLNQNYTVVGNKKNCRIALGHYSNPMCHVHDSFKCIVLVEETKLDYSDPPFLNRFEKQQFRFSDLIENDQFRGIINEIEETLEMLCHIEGCIFSPENVIPSYSRDMIVSLILHLKKTQSSGLNSQNDYINNALEYLLWILPPEVAIRARESRLRDKNPDILEKMIEMYLKLPVHEGLSHCLDALLHVELENDLSTEDDSSEKSSNGKLLLLYTYTNIHVNIRACLNTQINQIEKLSSFKSEKQLSNRVEEFFLSQKSVMLLQCSATYDSQHLLLSKVIIENIRRKTGSKNKNVCMVIHLDRSLTHEQQYVPINYLSGWKIIFLDSLEKPTTAVHDFMKLSKYEIVQERRPLDVYIIENLFWALTRIKFTAQNNSIENQKKMIEQLRSNETIIRTIEELIMKWIEESTTENSQQWCVDVARNNHELYKAGTFVGACENSIYDVIKTPLAMYLYRMLELQILSPVFIADTKSKDRIDVWRQIVLSESYINIRDMPPITGPECYSCSASFLTLKMPLSRMLMDKINSQKDEFIDIVRKIRMKNDIEDDEDLPIELFDKIVSECTDIICFDISDIYSIQYNEREEDYVHDFCTVHSRELTSITDERKARHTFMWALQHFIQSSDYQKNDLIQVMATIHAAVWLNAPIIASICQLVELSEEVMNISWGEFDECQAFVMDSNLELEEKKDVCAMSRAEFVDSLCLKLLPTKSTLDKFDSLTEWFDFVSVIVPVAKVVSYESSSMPALQLCQEIVSLIETIKDFDLELIEMLGELLLKDNGQINSPSAFDQIISILNHIHQSNPDYSLTLHRFYCYYIMRCLLSNPDDSQVLTTALDMVSKGKTFDKKLSYFGKCLDFVVMLESSIHEDLIINIVVDTVDEIPPFIECLDNFLQNVDTDETGENVLFVLLADAVQKSCLQESLQPENLLEITSVSHDAINCLSQAYDVIVKGNMSFRYISSVAYLRQFLQTYFLTLELVKFDTSELPIVSKQVNAILSTKWQGNGENVLNPLLVFLLKLFSNRYGIEQIYKWCKRVQNVFTCFDDIKWTRKYIESSVVFNPLLMHLDISLQMNMCKQINSVLEKENTLDELLHDTQSNVMMLFGVLSQRFYMRRCLRELSDNESRMETEINKIVKKSKLPDKCKHIVKYLVGEDFGLELFCLSEATETPYPEIVSIVLHICCLISTAADDTSVWYTNLYQPDISSMQFFPCCNFQPTTEASQKILHVLNMCTIIGSIGFHLTAGDALKISTELTPDPSSYFQNDLLSQYDELQYILQMNSSNLCIVLHSVIKKCETLITHESEYKTSKTIQQRESLQLQYTRIIDEILEDRWQIILDFKRNHCNIDDHLECIEAQIDELAKPSSSDANETITHDMFRISNIPTKDMFFRELQLGSKEDFPFLHLVIQNMNRFAVPQFIPSFLRWHMSVITFASYKFRKVDFRDLTVQKFFSQEIDDTRRNTLKKHFDQFKKAWNDIRDQYSDAVECMALEPMNQMVTMKACTIWNDESNLVILLYKLVNIHNSFLDKSAKITEQKQLPKQLDSYGHGTLPLLDIKRSDVVMFIWKDEWLRFSQCETEYGLGQKVNFDFRMIEEEIKKDMLFGKVRIQLPSHFPKPIFTDDLYQHSVELLTDIEKAIPQHSLTNEIRRSVEIKLDRDASFVTDLLNHLGMVLSLLNKTGGENSQPLIEYLEKWQNVTGMNSNIFKRILPEPIDSVKLGHVVTLYKWLEELNGISLVECLDETYHKTIPQEGKDVLKKIKENNMTHMEKLQHPLLVFVHRYLAANRANISIDHPLIDYIDTQDLWCKGDIGTSGVVAGSDKLCIPLRDMLSPLVLVENIFETVSFIQDAIKVRQFILLLTKYCL